MLCCFFVCLRGTFAKILRFAESIAPDLHTWRMRFIRILDIGQCLKRIVNLSVPKLPVRQESATGCSTSRTSGTTQRTSGRTNKGPITSKKFADETFDKAQVRRAKMATTPGISFHVLKIAKLSPTSSHSSTKRTNSQLSLG